MSTPFCLQKQFLFDSDVIESVCVRFLFILSSAHWDVKYVMLTRIGVRDKPSNFLFDLPPQGFPLLQGPVLDVLPVLPFQSLSRFLTDSLNLVIFTSWFKIKNKNHTYIYIQEKSPYGNFFLWLSGRALRKQCKRLWVKFPGNTHTDQKMYSLNALQVALDRGVC